MRMCVRPVRTIRLGNQYKERLIVDTLSLNIRKWSFSLRFIPYISIVNIFACVCENIGLV